jgi:hypothetical protein
VRSEQTDQALQSNRGVNLPDGEHEDADGEEEIREGAAIHRGPYLGPQRFSLGWLRRFIRREFSESSREGVLNEQAHLLPKIRILQNLVSELLGDRFGCTVQRVDDGSGNGLLNQMF